MAEIKERKKAFFLAFFWFFSVSLIQLNWLSQTAYHGIYILLVYVGLSLFCALQFALLSLVLNRLTLWNSLAAAAFWTLLEWSRYFVFCGFAFAPFGIPFSSNAVTRQIASLMGILGLSFLVVLTSAFSAVAYKTKRKKEIFSFIGVLLFPYLVGGALFLKRSNAMKASNQTFSALLIQTGLKPEEKMPLAAGEPFVSPYWQWLRVLHAIEENHEKVDLMVLPESTFPYGAKLALFPPALITPFLPVFETKDSLLTNLDIAKSLAKRYSCDLILGLDDFDEKGSYNAAFYVSEDSKVERYEKQKLVPLAEYLPLSILDSIVARYGIHSFFSHGREATIFHGRKRYGPSICFEECFSALIRRFKNNGAEILVNLTNDAYFPCTKLPAQHYELGRLRSVELGLPLLRSCNNGVTAGVDSLGRKIASIDEEWELKALLVKLPLFSYTTLYSIFGHLPLILFSFGILLLFFLVKKSRER